MVSDDVSFAIHLTDTMGWDLVEEDFQLMMGLEPDGCFVAQADLERVGLATTIRFGRVGWLGNVIVKETHRNKGVGSMIVKHSLTYLTTHQVHTVGLYAYIDKVPFYQKLGFQYDSDFVVMKGRGCSLPVEPYTRSITKHEHQTLTNMDSLCFGASRRTLLAPILLNKDNVCYVAGENEELLGFIVAKVYDGVVEIGPLTCRRDHDDVAIALLKATINQLQGRVISIILPEKESTITDTLRGLGFRDHFHVARMFYGPYVLNDCIYAAESLERG
jgi:predicted GNAT family N-acyltransferase